MEWEIFAWTVSPKQGCYPLRRLPLGSVHQVLIGCGPRETNMVGLHLGLHLPYLSHVGLSLLREPHTHGQSCGTFDSLAAATDSARLDRSPSSAYHPRTPSISVRNRFQDRRRNGGIIANTMRVPRNIAATYSFKFPCAFRYFHSSTTFRKPSSQFNHHFFLPSAKYLFSSKPNSPPNKHHQRPTKIAIPTTVRTFSNVAFSTLSHHTSFPSDLLHLADITLHQQPIHHR